MHVYDYTRDPELDHHNYGDYIYQNTDLDLYSKFGNIVVAVMVIVLAMILHKQQKRNCREKFIHEVKAAEHKDAAVPTSLKCMRVCSLNYIRVLLAHYICWKFLYWR